MFGFWFSIIGLVFGTFCSVKAKEKNRSQQDWFLAGFLFSLVAVIILYLLPDTNQEKEIPLNNKQLA